MPDGQGENTPNATNTGNDTVTMSQRAFSAVIGEAKREAREKATQDEEARIEERAAKKAAEIAEQKAEEVITRREKEREQKAAEEEQAKIRSKVNETAERLKKKFQEAGERHTDFNKLAGDYEWNDQRNQKILAQLDDEEVDNPGDVLHHLMKEDSIDKLSLKTPTAIKKRIKEISADLRESSPEKSEKSQKSDRSPPEPISRTRPSHIPTRGDGRPLKSGDFKGRAFRN